MWHVKYNDAFTEDLFNQLIAWCEKNRPEGAPWRGMDDTYKAFKSDSYKYFIWFDAKGRYDGYFAGVDNNPQQTPEISIADLIKIISPAPKHTDTIPYSELKEGEVYTEPAFNWIFKGSTGIITTTGHFTNCYSKYTDRVYKLATKEQRDHLQQCISAGKYVEYVREVSRDSEYVECTQSPQYWTPQYTVGKIYKVREDGYIPDDNGTCEIVKIDNRTPTSGYKFKPSTKLAFENQRVGAPSFSQNDTSCQFKVGDWVTIHIGDRSDFAKRHIGHTFEIKNVERLGRDGSWFVTGDKTPGGIYVSEIRKATPQEIAKVTGKGSSEDFLEVVTPLPTGDWSASKALKYMREYGIYFRDSSKKDNLPKTTDVKLQKAIIFKTKSNEHGIKLC